jgi:hypothetical protein
MGSFFGDRMNPAGFRKLALALPEAVECSHMNHPDFRVRKRVFATLGHPGPGWGMVKLTPIQQSQFVAAYPEVFVPVAGGWGLRGATSVNLRAATAAALRPAIFEAWRNVAPAGLSAELGRVSLDRLHPHIDDLPAGTVVGGNVHPERTHAAVVRSGRRRRPARLLRGPGGEAR